MPPIEPSSSLQPTDDAALYRDLVEHSHDIIQSVDSQGRFLYVNQTWRDVLGHTLEDVRTMNVFDLIAPDYREACQEKLGRIMGGETLRNLEVVFLSKEGLRIQVTGSVSCRFEGDLPVATRGIFHPVEKDRKESKAATSFDDVTHVCSWCRCVKRRDGSWSRSEKWLDHRFTDNISHGLCDACAAKALTDLEKDR